MGFVGDIFDAIGDLFGGGDDVYVNVPGPTPEEIEIQREQLRLMREAVQRQENLEPFILKSLGLVKNPDGTYRKMTEDEYYASLTDLEKKVYDTTKLMLERQQKALRGELPVSESLKQTKEREWKLFKEAMARAGNPIYGDTPEEATSPTTAGMQGIRQFQERFGMLEEAERRGELSAGTSAALQMLGVTRDLGNMDRQGLYGYTAAPLQLAGVYSGLLEPYQKQRMLEFQTNYANTASRSGLLGSFLGTIGTLGAAAIMSSKKFKKDIKETTTKEENQALETLKNMKTYTYRYKWEDDREPKRYGLLAENAPPEIVTPDRQGIDVGRFMGLLASASRAMARQIERRK